MTADLSPDQFPRCIKHKEPLTLRGSWWTAENPSFARLAVPEWHCPKGHVVHGLVLAPKANMAAERKSRRGVAKTTAGSSTG